MTSRRGLSGLRQARMIGAFTMVPVSLAVIVVHVWWFRSLVAAGTTVNLVLTIVPV